MFYLFIFFSFKILNLQKQIGSQAVKAQPQQATTKPTISAAPVERTPSGAGDTPRTANIRPMAGPAGHQTRQSAPVQPVRSIADTRAMASIRPMVPQPSVTPTATVMPTTVSIPDGMINLSFYFVKIKVLLRFAQLL